MQGRRVGDDLEDSDGDNHALDAILAKWFNKLWHILHGSATRARVIDGLSTACCEHGACERGMKRRSQMTTNMAGAGQQSAAALMCQ